MISKTNLNAMLQKVLISKKYQGLKESFYKLNLLFFLEAYTRWSK